MRNEYDPRGHVIAFVASPLVLMFPPAVVVVTVFLCWALPLAIRQWRLL